jgi:hypothetical protein
MFDVVGDTAVQQVPRAGLYGAVTEKDVMVQKAERGREARPVEKSNAGEKSRDETGEEEGTKTRTRLEEGKIFIEKYDEDGKLIKMIPPGYLPFGEIA